MSVFTDDDLKRWKEFSKKDINGAYHVDMDGLRAMIARLEVLIEVERSARIFLGSLKQLSACGHGSGLYVNNCQRCRMILAFNEAGK